MNADIAHYAAAVGAALADLPEAARAELMEDLPEHLAEVAAEAEAEGVSLADKIGPPAAYAAELRASLGHDAPQRFARWAERRARLRSRLRPLDARIGRLIGYARLTDLLRQLRPAWWVLRGYLTAVLVGGLLGTSWREGGIVPTFNHNPVLGVALVAVFVAGSIWLGRAAAVGGLKPRLLSGFASVILAFFAIAALAIVNGALTHHPGDGQPMEYAAQWQPQDVVVVDQNGHPVGPVGIVDLDSQGYLGMTVHTCDAMMPWEADRWPLLRTLCRVSTAPGSDTAQAPSATPSAAPSPTPSAAAAPTTTP